MQQDLAHGSAGNCKDTHQCMVTPKEWQFAKLFNKVVMQTHRRTTLLHPYAFVDGPRLLVGLDQV